MIKTSLPIKLDSLKKAYHFCVEIDDYKSETFTSITRPSLFRHQSGSLLLYSVTFKRALLHDELNISFNWLNSSDKKNIKVSEFNRRGEIVLQYMYAGAYIVSYDGGILDSSDGNVIETVVCNFTELKYLFDNTNL